MRPDLYIIRNGEIIVIPYGGYIKMIIFKGKINEART